MRRRWLRYSLRSMLVVVVMLSVWLGWMANKAANQRRAVAVIEELGGSVLYEGYEIDSLGFHLPERAPPGPTWLHAALGKDWCRSVVVVYLDQTRVTDQQFAEIMDDLPGITTLSFFDTKVGDIGLEQTELVELELDSTNVTDQGLRHIRACSRLASLSLGGNQITGAGLAHLSGLKKLRYLGLNYSNVTDVGLAKLQGLQDLEVLSLNDTHVTDAGLAYLSGLHRLTELDLARTKVTDAGLGYLTGLKKLEILDVWDTGVTDEGGATLKSVIPNVIVQLYSPFPETVPSQ